MNIIRQGANQGKSKKTLGKRTRDESRKVEKKTLGKGTK